MKLTEQERALVERAKALSGRATPGPWLTAKPTDNINGFSLAYLIAMTPMWRKEWDAVWALPPSGASPSADRDFIAAARELVPALIALIARLAGEPELVLWTPVEIGLPDEPGWHLVSSKDGDASFEAFYGRSGGWFDERQRDITWSITAWAKKPAPYRPHIDADAPERREGIGQ